MTTSAINQTNQESQENTLVTAEMERAGIVVSPQGEIEQDGYPAGAALAGRTGIATRPRMSPPGGISSDSQTDGEDDLFLEDLFPEEAAERPLAKLRAQYRTFVQGEDKCEVRIPARLTTKVRRISRRLNTVGKWRSS